MEWLIGIGSVLISVGVSVWIARWSDSRQEDRQMTQLAAQERRFEEELAEARRRWEEAGASVSIEGRLNQDKRDRHEDQVEIVISNSGRLATYVDRIELTDVAFIGRTSLVPDGYLPARLEPGEPLRLHHTRGELLDRGHNQGETDHWWESSVVEVYTGDGRLFRWNPKQGMDPEVAPI